jgi:hypothetical protein
MDLRAELGRVTTAALAAVGGTRRKACVALAADLFVAVVLGRKHLKRRLDDTATETNNVPRKKVVSKKLNAALTGAPSGE